MISVPGCERAVSATSVYAESIYTSVQPTGGLSRLLDAKARYASQRVPLVHRKPFASLPVATTSAVDWTRRRCCEPNCTRSSSDASEGLKSFCGSPTRRAFPRSCAARRAPVAATRAMPREPYAGWSDSGHAVPVRSANTIPPDNGRTRCSRSVRERSRRSAVCSFFVGSSEFHG